MLLAMAAAVTKPIPLNPMAALNVPRPTVSPAPQTAPDTGPFQLGEPDGVSDSRSFATADHHSDVTAPARGARLGSRSGASLGTRSGSRMGGGTDTVSAEAYPPRQDAAGVIDPRDSFDRKVQSMNQQ